MTSIIEEDIKRIASAKLPWERMEGKAILITGANGMLGAYLVETLLYLNEHKFRSKAKVLALVRDEEKAKHRFSRHKSRADLQFLVQDVCEPVKIDGRIDFIIHAASQASPKFYDSDPVGTLSANLIGTNNLLKLAREKKIESFLFFSSAEVYGDAAEKESPIKETSFGGVDTLSVRSCYSESKRAAETMCISWHHQHNVPVIIVRPFHTYGPGMRLDDGRVFADFVSDIVSNRNISLNSDGSAERAFCYISDATTGFFTILLKGKPGEAYNLGNESGLISIRKLAEMLVRLFPEKKLRVELNKKPSPEGYLKSVISRQCPDTSKIRALGWSPGISLKEGFSRTIKSFT